MAEIGGIRGRGEGRRNPPVEPFDRAVEEIPQEMGHHDTIHFPAAAFALALAAPSAASVAAALALVTHRHSSLVASSLSTLRHSPASSAQALTPAFSRHPTHFSRHSAHSHQSTISRRPTNSRQSTVPRHPTNSRQSTISRHPTNSRQSAIPRHETHTPKDTRKDPATTKAATPTAKGAATPPADGAQRLAAAQLRDRPGGDPRRGGADPLGTRQTTHPQAAAEATACATTHPTTTGTTHATGTGGANQRRVRLAGVGDSAERHRGDHLGDATPAGEAARERRLLAAVVLGGAVQRGDEDTG